MSSTALKVLVIGGSRFMGKQVVEDLVAMNCQVTTYNRGNTYWGCEVCEKVNRVIGDRSDDFGFRQFLMSAPQPWDAVVDFTSFDEEDMEQIVYGLREKTKHYVFISSDSTYNVCPDEEELAILRGMTTKFESYDPGEADESSDDAFILGSVLSDSPSTEAKLPLPPVRPSKKRTEDSCIRPKEDWIIKKYRKKDTYGDNKLICEELLAQSWKDFQFPYTAIRIPDVIGPFDNTKRHWRYQMWLRASNVQPVELAHLAHCQPLSFVFSKDVAKAVVEIIKTGTTVYGQSINIACEETPTLEEYLNITAKIIGVTPKYNFTKKGKHNLLPSVDFGSISIEKAKKMLPGWKPTSIENMLTETCKWSDEAWYKHPEERRWRKFSEDAVKELERVYEQLQK